MRKTPCPTPLALALFCLLAFIIGCATPKPARKVCYGVIGRCVDRAAASGMDRPESENGCMAACVRYGLLRMEGAIQKTFLSKKEPD